MVEVGPTKPSVPKTSSEYSAPSGASELDVSLSRELAEGRVIRHGSVLSRL